MINRNGNNIVCVFGKGDIGVCLTRYHSDLDDGCSCIGLFNSGKILKIGEKDHSVIGRQLDSSSGPSINMVFTKVESIDVVINNLRSARRELVKKLKRKKK